MTMNFSPVLEDWRNRDRNAASDANRKQCVRGVASAGFAALFCLVPVVDALAQRRMFDGWQGGPSMMPWNMGWIGSALMFALWVAFFAAVFIFIKRWIQISGKDNQAPPPRASAMDILRERYARGEIDKEEFEEKKRVLDGNG